MQEALGAHIIEAPVEEKIERILFVEDNIIGAENKRQLATYILPILTSAAFETYFQNPKTPLLSRLQRLAQIQQRMRRSGFIDVTREAIAARMDQLATAMEARGRLFDSIAGRNASAVEKAQTLLRLAAGGVLPEGLAARAREMILAYLSQPGFLAGYMAAQTKDGAADNEKLMAELMEMLSKAGITVETGLKTIAA
jgi:hypothetical protein